MPQDDLVERVARAIAEAYREHRDIPSMARAAIEAMGFTYEYRLVRVAAGAPTFNAPGEWQEDPPRLVGWEPDEWLERRLVGPPERIQGDE